MIDIGIALSRNSEDYLKFLIRTVKATALMPIRYILGINAGADIGRVEEIVRDEDAVVFDANVGTDYGSHNHGRCLDVVFSRMSSRFGMLVDCDVAFLQRGWDVEMLLRLDGTHVIVGAEYDGEKYRGFPNVIGAMMDLDSIRSLGVSFRPMGRVTLNTREDAELYGYTEFPTSINLDTGAELVSKIKRAGLRGVPMPMYRANASGARFMTADLRGEEYVLDNVPLFTHIGRSYTRPITSPEGIAWMKRVEEWLCL